MRYFLPVENTAIYAQILRKISASFPHDFHRRQVLAVQHDSPRYRHRKTVEMGAPTTTTRTKEIEVSSSSRAARSLRKTPMFTTFVVRVVVLLVALSMAACRQAETPHVEREQAQRAEPSTPVAVATGDTPMPVAADAMATTGVPANRPTLHGADLKRRSAGPSAEATVTPKPCSIRTTVRLPIPPWADSVSLNIGGVLYWYEFRAPAKTSFYATFANVPCSVDPKTLRPEQFQFWVTKKKAILVAKKRTALSKE